MTIQRGKKPFVTHKNETLQRSRTVISTRFSIKCTKPVHEQGTEMATNEPKIWPGTQGSSYDYCLEIITERVRRRLDAEQQT